MEFFSDILEFAFLQRAVLAIVLASLACGIVGSYVVVRRNTYMAGAVSHSLLGGIGIALLLEYWLGWHWLTPNIGALISAILIAILITLMSQRWQIREDTALSAVWALGMAVGISAILAIPGYPPDLNAFLFGNILLTSSNDIWMTICLDSAIALLVFFFHQRFVAYSFNPEILVLRGVNTFFIALLMNLMTAMTVVILSQLAGLILCIALLVIPAATASMICRRLPTIMTVSGIICLLCSIAGIILSYQPLSNGITLAAGPTIVELSGLIFLITFCVKKIFWRSDKK